MRNVFYLQTEITKSRFVNVHAAMDESAKEIAYG